MNAAIDNEPRSVERELVAQGIAVRVSRLVVRPNGTAIDEQPIGAVAEAEVAGPAFVDELALLLPDIPQRCDLGQVIQPLSGLGDPRPLSISLARNSHSTE